MVKRHAILTLTLLLLTVAGPVRAERIEIRAFESAVVGDLVIGFEQLLFEERCPLDATCFWEGDAAIQIHVSRNGEDPRDYELHSHPDFGSVVTYDGWTLGLIELLPHPLLDTEPVPEDYVAVLEVKSVVATETVSWSAMKSRF